MFIKLLIRAVIVRTLRSTASTKIKTILVSDVEDTEWVSAVLLGASITGDIFCSEKGHLNGGNAVWVGVV